MFAMISNGAVDFVIFFFYKRHNNYKMKVNQDLMYPAKKSGEIFCLDKSWNKITTNVKLCTFHWLILKLLALNVISSLSTNFGCYTFSGVN